MSTGDDAAVPNTRKRGPATVADMVRSLGLVLLLVLVVVLITFRPQGQAVTPVDYRATLAAARSGAPFALVGPVGLPATWTATSAYYDPAATHLGVTSWHVGFVTAHDAYAGFEQTDGVAAGVLRDVLGDPVDPHQTGSIGGATWSRWVSSGGDRRALVRTSSGVTVVVDGSAVLGRAGAAGRLTADQRVSGAPAGERGHPCAVSAGGSPGDRRREGAGVSDRVMGRRGAARGRLGRLPAVAGAGRAEACGGARGEWSRAVGARGTVGGVVGVGGVF